MSPGGLSLLGDDGDAAECAPVSGPGSQMCPPCCNEQGSFSPVALLVAGGHHLSLLLAHVRFLIWVFGTYLILQKMI